MPTMCHGMSPPLDDDRDIQSLSPQEAYFENTIYVDLWTHSNLGWKLGLSYLLYNFGQFTQPIQVSFPQT